MAVSNNDLARFDEISSDKLWMTSPWFGRKHAHNHHCVCRWCWDICRHRDDKVRGPYIYVIATLQSRHNEHDGVSNHQPDECLLNRLFRRRSKKTSKLRVTGLCEGNSPVTGEFLRASNAQNVSIWWHHHVLEWFSTICKCFYVRSYHKICRNLVASQIPYQAENSKCKPRSPNLLEVFQCLNGYRCHKPVS